MPMLPTFSLLSPFRESIAENGRSIKNGGHPWGGRMYGQSVLRCILDTVKAGRRPYHPGAHWHGWSKGAPAVRGSTAAMRLAPVPHDWNEKPLR